MIFILTALLFFTLGFIFSYWVLDIVNGLVKLLLTKLEAASGKDSIKIAKINEQINSMSSNEPPRIMGFQPSPEIEIEEEDGEDEI